MPSERDKLIEQLLNDGYVPRAMQDEGAMVEIPNSIRRHFAERLADFVLSEKREARIDELNTDYTSGSGMSRKFYEARITTLTPKSSEEDGDE